MTVEFLEKKLFFGVNAGEGVALVQRVAVVCCSWYRWKEEVEAVRMVSVTTW
jgi:hypothetical protein